MTREDTIKMLLIGSAFSRQEIEAAADHLDKIILEDKLPGLKDERARYKVLNMVCRQAASVGGKWRPIHGVAFISAIRKAMDGTVKAPE